MSETLAFIGGGNMASAIVGGLVRAGRPAASIIVVEPLDAQRERLRSQSPVRVLAAADRDARAGARSSSGPSSRRAFATPRSRARRTCAARCSSA